MSEVILTVQGSTDDARSTATGGSYNETAATQYMGNFGGTSFVHLLRWTNVTVPAGATISSAILDLYSAGTTAGSQAKAKFYGEANDNAPTSSSSNKPSDRPLTTASATKNFTNSSWLATGFGIETVDVTSIIQEILARAGWADGNALAIIAKDNGSSTDNYIGFSTYDRSAARGARLTITYTGGSGGGGGGGGGSSGTWQSFTQAWLYPGAPACNAPNEYKDGRVTHTLKPEYYRVNASGVLEQITVAIDGCNAYSVSNAAEIKAYSTDRFFTISSGTANMAALCSNSTKRANAISTIISFLGTIGFDGVELDFEGFGGWSAGNYTDYKTFVTELGNALHAAGYKLMIDCPPIGNVTEQGYYQFKYEDFNALPVDYIVALAYDYQYDYGGGSAIAPNAWVTAIVTWVKTKITDVSKIVIGMPSYGYGATTAGYDVTIYTKTQISALTGYSSATRDPNSYEMMFTNAGKSYSYNDTAGLNSKREMIEALGIQNISVWHLGGNDWFNGKDEPTGEIVPPNVPTNTVVTGSVTGITTNQAQAAAEITEVVSNATKRGFEYGTQQTAQFEVSTSGNYGIGIYSSNIAGLASNTTYYVRAFIDVSGVRYYGDWVSFTTTADTPQPVPVTEYSITINGVDRRNDIIFPTLHISDNINEIVNTCSFDLADLSGAGIPTTDQVIIIIQDGVAIFSGYITRITANKFDSGIPKYSCECVDFTRDLDRQLVAETYTGMTDKAIIEDIVSNYCSGLGITTNNVVEGATINQITFNYVQVSQALATLCQLTGRFWFIDYAKDLHYVAIGSTPAPFSTIDSSSNTYKELTLTNDNQNIKNRVYVRGSTELSDPYTVSQAADGTQRQFILPDQPHNFSMKQGGVTKTVGIKNIDDPGAFDYMLNFQEKYVECGTLTATPAAGVVMAFTYQYDVPILVAVEDPASIASVGVFEFLITDKNITTTQAARDRAQAELNDYADSLVDGTFTTYVPGFKSGQSITINMPTLGVNGDYIIQKVDMATMGAGKFEYKITLASSITIGIIKFLIKMLEGSQNKVTLDTQEVVDELLLVTDSLGAVTDSLIIDSHAPYYSWFDSLDTPGSGSLVWDLGQWM